MLARKLHSSGGDVRIVLLGDPQKFKGSAKINYEIVLRIGIDLIPIENLEQEELKRTIMDSDLVVDAIFGTGLSKEIKGKWKEVIDYINQHSGKVLSLDIPSGINGDTAKVMGTSVKADYTVTFGLPKVGNILYPGFEYQGELFVTHISFPPEHYNGHWIKLETNDPIRPPKRDRQGHKGTFGNALFIAGARSYLGAPYFSSLSFIKAGGGYSRLATPSAIVPFIGSKGSEIVFHPMEETKEGTISFNNLEKILEIVELVDIVVMGPGLSLNEETQKLILELIPKIKRPLIVDGDGLTALSRQPDILKKRPEATILTPHPGEMARITGKSTNEILEKRLEILRETSKSLNSIVVLKGAHSLIGLPDGRVYVNMTGNPGMASAGSGDVLTGTIAAMYGIGLDIDDAVRMGVFVHGLAGDIAAKKKGEDGITAQDILDFIPYAMKLLRDDFEGICREYCLKII